MMRQLMATSRSRAIKDSAECPSAVNRTNQEARTKRRFSPHILPHACRRAICDGHVQSSFGHCHQKRHAP